MRPGRGCTGGAPGRPLGSTRPRARRPDEHDATVDDPGPVCGAVPDLRRTHHARPGRRGRRENHGRAQAVRPEADTAPGLFRRLAPVHPLLHRRQGRLLQGTQHRGQIRDLHQRPGHDGSQRQLGHRRLRPGRHAGRHGRLRHPGHRRLGLREKPGAFRPPGQPPGQKPQGPGQLEGHHLALSPGHHGPGRAGRGAQKRRAQPHGCQIHQHGCGQRAHRLHGQAGRRPGRVERHRLHRRRQGLRAHRRRPDPGHRRPLRHPGHQGLPGKKQGTAHQRLPRLPPDLPRGSRPARPT